MNDHPSYLLILCSGVVAGLICAMVCNTFDKLERVIPKSTWWGRLKRKIRRYGPSELKCGHGIPMCMCPVCNLPFAEEIDDGGSKP